MIETPSVQSWLPDHQMVLFGNHGREIFTVLVGVRALWLKFKNTHTFTVPRFCWERCRDFGVNMNLVTPEVVLEG